MNERKKAFEISFICVFIYISNYLFRNLLSVFTPVMLETGDITKDVMALLSSAYMMSYAIGQVVFGITGDYVNPKIMVSGGLCVAGVSMLVFPLVNSEVIKVITYVMLGLGLSAMRGPLVKVISENTEQKYARIACTFLSFASFVGPFAAGLLALFMKTNGAYIVSAVIAFAFALMTYTTMTAFEKKGYVSYKKTEAEKISIGGIFSLFKIEKFISYMLIGMIVEISTTTVAFWTPTYISERLGFPAKTAGVIFSVISFSKALSPFICLALLKLLKDKDMTVVLSMSAVSALSYLGISFISNKWINIGVFILASVTVAIVSATLWSVYIPWLGKFNKSSSANGIIDCSGYLAAAASNMLFVSLINKFGWSGMFGALTVFSVLAMAIAFVTMTAIRKKSGELCNKQ